MKEPALLIPMIALFIPMVIVPVIAGIRHDRYKRGLEHAERMRALELGRTLPQDETWFSPAKISLAIGAGVPVLVFGIAQQACERVGYREEIFVSAGLVGATAVVCGSFLAARCFNLRATSEAPSSAPPTFDKANFDADAYDVAGSRG